MNTSYLDYPVNWRSMEEIRTRMYNEIDQLRNQVSAMDELVNHLEQRLIRLERGVADSEMGQALSR